ncbi:MAG: hypothetical protein A3C84_04140 [Candidatus Ryanbacteria bacterium RIFCSPHIGHO2_02_FULL_48_12]|uniref:Four helix bundle protein n=1 Tax=Candidatus Ryanbacteria bacterium RIFCSPHIGHO2_01_FULL_48_27 TaxID=1802115 RepID=A0A1G2G5K1_9BACT|nr:MAG: hypothetical protein A2756_00815 [Candidatus Ryanbacteria bacterium RIFCSPHIGHO2_01_FULL_48_27]OGZ48554.1 MAG: hypothetical protein A3C84_04140 [Candidatus Ryanbacteria bacterium RIFCSPHIGHO2_02_FULL_48_12]
MAGFQDLKVWQEAHRLVLRVYEVTASFPDAERYGLVSQAQRAAVSIAANIAEGTKRNTGPDRARFYVIADTSLEEVRYYLILSRDLQYVTMGEYDILWEHAANVGRMLNGLLRSSRQ